MTETINGNEEEIRIRPVLESWTTSYYDFGNQAPFDPTSLQR